MDPNEKLTGIASIPQSGPQGMPTGGMMSMGNGQPPMPQPEMSGPPPMPMGSEEPPMEPVMGGEEPPMNVEQDAAMLAEAVVGRTQGDVQSAIDVLDTAKAMLMSSGSQEPQMMMGGGPLYANMGKPLYAESGTTISNSDSMDTLRQMIMDDLAQTTETANKQLGKLVSGQEGRSMSDKDTSRLKQFMDLYKEEMAAYNEVSDQYPFSDYMDIITKGGRALSDKDAQMLYEMGIKSGEIGSATNPNPLDSLPKRRPMVSKRAGGGTLMSGNAMAELDRYRFG